MAQGVVAASVTMLLLTGCTGGDVSQVSVNGQAAAEEGAGDDTQEESGTQGGAEGPGTAVVVLNGERYESNELSCSDLTGFDFGGPATGPRDNARIHGRFGTALPDLIGVSFARGDEGEFSAIQENEIFYRGVLEDYVYDVDARTYQGTAHFAWIDEDKFLDPDLDLIEGTFEVRC
jgi:hypothetical protein